MPIGEVLNRCACSYLDHLLQHTSVHRDKPVNFMLQRLIVVASRASPSVTQHAARIILSSLGFTFINASSKKFIDEAEAISLIGSITDYASEEHYERTGIEVKGAKKMFDAICETIIEAVANTDDDEATSLMKNFVQKVVANFYPSQALVIFNRIIAERSVQRILQPVFLRFIEFSPEYPDLYATIARTNFQPLALVRIVANFLDKETKQSLFSETDDPLKIVEYLVQNYQASNERNAEIIHSLAYLLFAKSKGVPVDESNMEEEGEEKGVESGGLEMANSGYSQVLFRRSQKSRLVEPLREAIGFANRDAILRVLEIHGIVACRDVEGLTAKLLGCAVQRNLVTTRSVACSFLYMCVTTCDVSYQTEKDLSLGIPVEEEENKLIFWDSKVFIETIRQYPKYLEERGEPVEEIRWVDVVKEIDHPEFLAHWKVLPFMQEFFNEAFNDPDEFPLDFYFKPWRYLDAQFSFWRAMVEKSQYLDLSIYPHVKVITPQLQSMLKQQHDPTNTDFRVWNMLDVTNMFLAGAASDGVVLQVMRNCFEFGYERCPDVIVLALLQSTTPWNNIRMDLLKSYLPTFIMQNVNAVPILNFAWSDATIQKHVKSLVINAFASNYNADDPQKLAKILDIAHEIKPAGLSELLQLAGKNLQFVVELACLASKRDYLNLEKWLEDKEKAHGDAVVMTVLNYIQRKYKRSQLVATAASQKAGGAGTTSTDPIGVLWKFVEAKATPQHLKHHGLILSVMKENSGRSSSVSSAGGRNSVQIGPAVFGSGPPPPVSATAGPPDLQPPIQPPPQQSRPTPIQPPRGTFAVPAPPGSAPQSTVVQPPPAHLLAQQAQMAAPGRNMMLNMGPFGTGGGSAQDLLKVVQATPPPPPSMSPSSQIVRSTIPLLAHRQNSSSGGWMGAPAPPGSRAPGPATPQHMSFGQLAPGSSIPDFVPQRIGVIGSGQQIGSNIQTPQHPLTEEMNFAEDIQEEANSYFEKIYSSSNAMSVEDLIKLLKSFKHSNNPREQKILACVVKNLFEEYRFFHEYPERELRTTAAVYGGIIREAIIGNVQFATAVRKVIESLAAEPNSMLWTFGIVALQHCRSKLCTYPKVCTMIAGSENFSKFPQSLKDYVLAGVKGELPADAGRNTPTGQTNWGAVARAASVDPKTSLPANRTGNSVLSYTNVDTLVTATEKDGAEIAQPQEAVVDKISFLFNNLSSNNLQQKKEEIVSLINEHGEGFTVWLAQYIVMKRVSIEQNFQPLYNQFCQAIDNPLLDACIKKETFRNIKILLRTDKKTTVASNYSDRQLLKNLGMWLGSITIARNKPILLDDLDLKSLLLEAYYKGQAELLFVVPFISKILLSCSKSSIFTPSCAWIRAILKVLAELHNEPDLKINLKFEIEVLCKELNTDLNQLPIDGVLKDTEKLVRVPQQLCEVRVLGRPDVPSPVPSQLKLTGSTDILPAPSPALVDANRSTPLPEGADGLPTGGAQGAAEAQVAPNVTHFAYHDINVLTYEGLVPHVKLQANLPLFQLHPHAKHLVRPAMTHAIKELIGPVTERALKIAMTVTESMIKKDFAMDPDEKNMKLAAFHMMRAMTAGMAMITCRDPLASTMIGNMTQAFQSSLRSSTSNPELKQMIELASQTITQDNVELATNFIVKTACEKASAEIEKRLEAEYQKRILARQSNEVFKDEATAMIQKKLPPQIAIPPGTIEKANLAVYEQFSSRICGFKPSNDEGGAEQDIGGTPGTGAGATNVPPAKEMEAICNQMQHFIKEVDQTTQAQPHINHLAFHAVCSIRDSLSNVVALKDPVSLVTLINRSVEHLLHAYHLENATKVLLDVEWTRRLRDLFIGVMRLLQVHFNTVDLNRRVTTAVINIRSDYKWNLEGIEVLFKQNLIHTALWDQHLAASMDNGGNLEATLFAQKFVRNLGGGDIQKISFLKEKFPLTCEQLTKLHQLQSATRAAVESTTTGGNTPNVTNPSTPLQSEPAGLSATVAEVLNTRPNDDTDMTAKVEMILRDWIQICYSPTAQRNPQEALSQMINLMHSHGVLSTDEKITTFFRLCVEMCVDVSVRMLKTEQLGMPQSFLRHRCYYTLDAFVKLMALMIRHSDNGQTQNKINLLKKILNIIVGVLHIDHEVRRNEFNSMPYHRILISLFNEITGPDPQKQLEPIAWSILEAFGQTFFALQPRRVPGFAFAWLDIVGHRNVIGRLLANTGIAETVDRVKTAATYTQLIISHLKFLAPFLRNIQLPKSIAILYKGTLRILLVILHDFPELLCEFHYVICDTIPPNCVQLRNLVLSAYPRNMRLPDPFALNFKQVDSIPEMAIEPKSNLNMATIIPDAIRIPLDEYLANRSSVDFLSSLPSLLQIKDTPNMAGARYNTTVMNALVLYVGIRAIENLHAHRQRISIQTIAHKSYMDIFQNLAVQLCTEGRYLLFNGIANQLRYPNAHTHYFSCVFLFLFRNSDCDAIQEQITRILFERLVALRPHPWGLLITFIELIKNPTYNFWKYEFTRCAPEIERLFQNVANTCVPAQGTTATASSAAAAAAAATAAQVAAGSTTETRN